MLFKVLIALSCLVVAISCNSKLKIEVVDNSIPEGCTEKSKKGDMLTMHYKGTLVDGTVFDSSTDTCTTSCNINSKPKERTFLMIKPDGIHRGLIGKIIQRFEENGFKLIAMKFVWPSIELLEQHYAELSDRPFFSGLIKYMSSGPVVPMVWEGINIVKIGRKIIGATNPMDAAPGTIRGDMSVQVGRNLIHGSDGIDSAEKEISVWFTENELVNWNSALEPWIDEDN